MVSVPKFTSNMANLYPQITSFLISSVFHYMILNYFNQFEWFLFFSFQRKYTGVHDEFLSNSYSYIRVFFSRNFSGISMALFCRQGCFYCGDLARHPSCFVYKLCWVYQTSTRRKTSFCEKQVQNSASPLCSIMLTHIFSELFYMGEPSTVIWGAIYGKTTLLISINMSPFIAKCIFITVL